MRYVGRKPYQVKLAIACDTHMNASLGMGHNTFADIATAAVATDADLFLHLGDFDPQDETDEAALESAFGVLDGAGMEYLCVTGNHDLADVYGNLKDSITSTVTKARMPWVTGWHDSTVRNWYRVATINGVPLLFIGLECAPWPAAMEWADGIAKQYPHHLGIVLVHASIYKDGTMFQRATDEGEKLLWNLKGEVESGVWTFDGWDIWQRTLDSNAAGFLRGNSNLRLLLCGHCYPTNARRVDTRDDGTACTQIMAAYQGQIPVGWYREISLDVVSDRIMSRAVRSTSPFGGWLSGTMPQSVFNSDDFVLENAGIVVP